MRPLRMSAVIRGKRYTTDAAALLASGESDGGPVWLPKEKSAFLFRGADGAYFAQFRTKPAGAHNEGYWLEPLSELEAIPLYWELAEKETAYEEAFPPGKPL